MNFDQPVRVVDWRKAKRTLLITLFTVGSLGSLLSGWLWSFVGALVCAATILCMAAGFWVTEGLVGVFTRTKNASPAAILLLFTGKLAWWAALFAAARHMPPRFDRPIGVGIGSFLLSLLIAMPLHYGMPRISDGNPPGLS